VATNNGETGTASDSPYNFFMRAVFADSLNTWIRYAQIGFGDQRYNFSKTSTTSFETWSLQFIVKDNKLMAPMNIPLNGNGDYGLKEVPLQLSGQYGSGSPYFYGAFKYLRECNSIKYQNIYVFFNQDSDNDIDRKGSVETAFKRFITK